MAPPPPPINITQKDVELNIDCEPKERLNICMVSDFFYPNVGGVENHLFNLSMCIIERGHKVVIVTHAYGDRSGVRWMSRGLKAFSSLCHEAIFHGKNMGIPSTFTDHSLFGFADISSILTNKLLKFTLSDVNNIICVSNTSKENTVLRAAVDPEKVFVIPNAVISNHFTPDPTKRRPDRLVLSRLVYRKGVDLLVAIIPKICKTYDNVHFLIAGDGPKKVDLEQMRDEYLLHNQVELVGAVPSERARDVMAQGNIFLNTSLTEAFCMAIVEAASCGLLVVSTKVGGIPEVLPEDMILLSAPEEEKLTKTLSKAIEAVLSGKIDTSSFHQRVSSMYCWTDVACRTENVYLQAHNQETITKENDLLKRLSHYYGCGEIFGKIACLLVLIDYLLLSFLDWVHPVEEIDIAPDFNYTSIKDYSDWLRSGNSP